MSLKMKNESLLWASWLLVTPTFTATAARGLDQPGSRPLLLSARLSTVGLLKVFFFFSFFLRSHRQTGTTTASLYKLDAISSLLAMRVPVTVEALVHT